MPNPQEVLEYLASQKKTPETPENNIEAGGTPKRPNVIDSPNRVVITGELYETMIRQSERLKLIENYILNNEFCSNDTLRAMVGYTEEE